MRVERAGVASFQLTLHGYELAALVSAARWVAEGGEGDLAPEARESLQQLLDAYDAQLANLRQ